MHVPWVSSLGVMLSLFITQQALKGFPYSILFICPLLPVHGLRALDCNVIAGFDVEFTEQALKLALLQYNTHHSASEARQFKMQSAVKCYANFHRLKTTKQKRVMQTEGNGHDHMHTYPTKYARKSL